MFLVYSKLAVITIYRVDHKHRLAEKELGAGIGAR